MPTRRGRRSQPRASTKGPVVSVELGDAYDLVADLEPDSIDLILTSPPYWGHRSYDQAHNWDLLREWKSRHPKGADVIPSYPEYRKLGGLLGLEPLPEWYVLHLVEIFERARPALKPGGSVWVNIGDTYFTRWSSIREHGRQGLGDNPRQRRRTPMGGYRQEKQLLLVPARFAIAMQERRWILRNDVIWYKPNVPPRPERDRLRLELRRTCSPLPFGHAPLLPHFRAIWGVYQSGAGSGGFSERQGRVSSYHVTARDPGQRGHGSEPCH